MMLFLLFPWLVPNTGEPMVAHDGPLSLSVRPAAALTGGPVVLHCELRNRGKLPLILESSPLQNSRVFVASVKQPFIEWRSDAWVSESRSSTGTVREESRLEPGETVAELVHLHHTSAPLPTKGSYVVAWDQSYFILREFGGRSDRQPALHPHLRMTVTLADPTPLDWALARARASDAMFRHGNSFAKRWEGWGWISHHPRADCLSLALRFLDVMPYQELGPYLGRYLFKTDDRPERVNDRIVAEMSQPDMASARIFCLWRSGVVTAPTQVQRGHLARSSSIWVRALTVGAFATDGSREAHDASAELNEWLVGKPTCRLEGLVTNLDSARYSVREAAEKTLGLLGDPAAVYVARRLELPGSAESHERLKRVLALAVSERPTTDAMRTVSVLAELDTPAARQLLRVIADGPKQFPASEAARRLLNRNNDGR